MSGNSTGHISSAVIDIPKSRGLVNGARRRSALKQFLKSRRSLLSPRDVGIVTFGRRNASGLRREEVAVRAGVSASWYTWLEQGRNIKVSGEVVEAVGAALNLEGIDRAHLFLLAGLNPPPVVLDARPEEITQLGILVDRLLPVPVYCVDRYWNNLFSNELASNVFGPKNSDYNYLTGFFADQSAKDLYVNWDTMATRLVGQFRIQSARFPRDPNFDHMAAQLCAMSPDFADIWERHETCDSTTDRVDLRLPDGEVARFRRITLGLFERYDVRLVLHIPVDHMK